jgi:hypothetical protein
MTSATRPPIAVSGTVEHSRKQVASIPISDVILFAFFRLILVRFPQ